MFLFRLPQNSQIMKNCNVTWMYDRQGSNTYFNIPIINYMNISYLFHNHIYINICHSLRDLQLLECLIKTINNRNYMLSQCIRVRAINIKYGEIITNETNNEFNYQLIDE